MATPPLLHHTSINPAGKPSILFIHGAFGTGNDWDLVTPHLPPSYHILLPDLPGHGALAPTHPTFTSALSASTLATLIRQKAHSGRAHIVGLSLGAHVAIDLACQYPDVCLDVLVSGFQIFEQSSALGRYMPQALYLQSRLESFVPRSLMRSVMSGADIQPSYPSLELCKQVGAPIASTEIEPKSKWPEPWLSRTLIIAAGKAGLLPTADHPDDAIKLAEMGRRGNAETVAYTHPGIRHPWNRQEPKLFAELVVAWVERRELPEGFVRLG